MSKLNNQCNSPGSPGQLSSYNQRMSYAEKYMTKENSNNHNMDKNKGYSDMYKDSKDFKQQIMEMKSKTRCSKNNFHHNTQEAVNYYI